MGKRHILKGSSEEIRAVLQDLITAVAPYYPPPSDAVVTKDHHIGDLLVRVYTKKDSQSKSLPVGIYGHGGGWCSGSVDGEDGMCRLIVEHLDTLMVSVEYRLAPEHKAPAQLEDQLKAFKWTLENAESFGGDPKRLYTIGSSAGASLSLAVARKVVLHQTDLPTDSVKGIVALVPAAFHHTNIPDQYKNDHTSYEDNKLDTPIIDGTSLDDMFGYVGLGANDQDYLIGSDLESHKKLPPTYIVTCEFDPLRDDGKILEKSLNNQGVPVKRDHYDGLPHAFWAFPTLPETQLFAGNLFAGIMWVIGQMK